MADGKDVTLTIKVKDQEVNKSEESLKRLKKAADDLGTSTKALTQQEKLAKFLGNDVKKGADAAAKGLEDVEKASAGTSEGLAGVAAAGGPVGVILASVAAAMVVGVGVAAGLAKEITHLAKEFADYTLEISRGSEETGLAIKTVAALRYEAEATGKSFGALTGPINDFRKTIGQAVAGSEDARKKLNLLGIDGTKAIYDVDGAFKQAITRIVSAPTEVEKIRLSLAAFGDEGYKLIPFFQSFNGNVDEAIKKAQELGLIVSGKDVDAAKAFTRAYTDLQKQVQGIAFTFGKEFLPIVVGALRDFSKWVGDNKTAITDWAKTTGNFVAGVITAFKELIQFVNDHPILTRIILGVQTLGASEATIQTFKNLANASQGATTVGGDKTIDYTRPQDIKPDPAAVAALQAQADKLREEREKEAKAELSAQVQLVANQISNIEKIYDSSFKKLTDGFKETGDVDQYKSNFQALEQWYGGVINDLAGKWSELVHQQTLEDKKGQNQRYLAYKETQDKIDQLGQKSTSLESQMTKEIQNEEKRRSEDAIRAAEETLRKRIELEDLRNQHEIENREYSFQRGITTEQQYLDFIKNNSLESLQTRKKELEEFLAAYQVNAKKRAEIEGELKKLDSEIFQQQLRNERLLTAEQLARQAIRDLERENADRNRVDTRRSTAAAQDELALKRQIAQLNDAIANAGINDSLIIEAEHLKDVLDYRQQELNAVIAINRAQFELSHSMEISGNQIKAQVLDHLAQQKTLNQAIADGINGTYDAIASKLDEQIDKMFKWAGAFKSLFTEPLKALARNNLTNFTTKILDAVFPGLGTQFKDANMSPVAKPIVEEIRKTNKLLEKLVGVGGGSSGAGGGLGGLFSSLGITGFGGPIAGGGGGATTSTVPGGGGSSPGILGSILGQLGIGGGASGGSTGGGLGGIFKRIVGPGGIFGDKGFGNNVGTYGGIGAIGSLVGGAVGGKVGGIISSTASGLAIGAQIGSIIPGIGTAIGAAIGAAVGFFAGLFGSDPKKKKDKEENIPKLNAGFTDAIKQLNDILAGVRSLSIDPDEALKQAADVRAQIAGGFGIQFESSKYRKQAQQSISSKLTEADNIIAQIRASAEIARGAADRSKRILPEFASGVYFADYFRPNGLMPGMFDGKDNILAMISRGEMVLNPNQQNRIRALAGGDVFAGAGIPNYPRASSSPKLATGGIAGAGLALAATPPQIVFQPNLTMIIDGVAVKDEVKAWFQSDDGKRIWVRTIIEEKKGNSKL